MPLTKKCLIRCFLRTYMIITAYNQRGLQNIPFIYAIDPALESLYPKKSLLTAARHRHSTWYNCHPFFTPLVLGMMLSLEKNIAHGYIQPDMVTSIKTTTANTLSALGDSFFSGSVMVLWVFIMTIFFLQHWIIAAVITTLGLLLLLQLFKVYSFFIGYTQGLSALNYLKKINLINWADRVKYVNAMLLAFILFSLFPKGNPVLWFAGTLVIFIIGRLSVRSSLLRVFLALLLICGMIFFDVTWLDSALFSSATHPTNIVV